MSVASVTEISATSTQSFDDAVAQGIARATDTLRNVKGAWDKESKVDMEDGSISAYKVKMQVTFLVDN